MKFFLKDFKDIKKVSTYWIAAQERINLFNDGTIFLKTHNISRKKTQHVFTVNRLTWLTHMNTNHSEFNSTNEVSPWARIKKFKIFCTRNAIYETLPFQIHYPIIGQSQIQNFPPGRELYMSTIFIWWVCLCRILNSWPCGAPRSAISDVILFVAKIHI